jgi:hypothetical protein
MYIVSFIVTCKHGDDCWDSSIKEFRIYDNGKPHTSQSVPPCAFSNVQCGHILIPGPDPSLLSPRAAASSAAIWSNTSCGMSSSLDDAIG